MVRTALLAVTVLLALCAGTATAASDRVSVRDPAGGGRWIGTLSSTSGGQTCATVRRRGSRRDRGRFCSPLNRSSAFLYGLYHRTTVKASGWRTVYVVALDRSVVRARLAVPGRTVRYRRRGKRGPQLVVVVVRGYTERGQLRAAVDLGNGAIARVGTRALTVQTADPGGGAAWRAAPDRAERGAAGCVRWERVPPRFAKPPRPARGDEHCGGASARLVTGEAEVVRRADRTVVTGLVGADVRAVRVRTAEAERTATLDAATGAFVGVLSGEAEQVVLVLTLGDGTEIERDVGTAG